MNAGRFVYLCMEIWKNINTKSGLFYISNHGNVKRDERIIIRNNRKYRCPAKICKQTIDKKGYKTVRLDSILYRVHRLVALYFIQNPDNKPYINHIDCNPSNNHFSNLEWCTQKENVNHAKENGLLNNPINNGMSKSVYQIDIKSNKIIAQYTSCAEAGRMLNINGNSINRCAAGNRPTAFGFKWSYKTV